MELDFAEMHRAIGAGIGREDRENDFLVLIARKRTHQENVGLVVGVLGVENSSGFFLELIA